MAPKLPMIDIVVGARPNFMKAAPVCKELRSDGLVNLRMVHTGQHSDPVMTTSLFDDLPCGGTNELLTLSTDGTGHQVARIMLAYDALLDRSRPDWIIAIGDVDSALAISLVAKKRLIQLAHLEAGLRSKDRDMPEEINRVVIDSISDLLWTPSADADANLAREGVPAERIDRVGNVMIDTFEILRPRIESCALPFALKPKEFCVATLHRPSNVDSRYRVVELLDALSAIADNCPLVFPLHPRTRDRLERLNMMNRLTSHRNIMLTAPLSYIEFMSLVSRSLYVITDSGGVQEETTYLGIPCFTLRENTERPITVSQGTNRLVNCNTLVEAAAEAKTRSDRQRPVIPLWDGNAARRVAQSLYRQLQCSPECI